MNKYTAACLIAVAACGKSGAGGATVVKTELTVAGGAAAADAAAFAPREQAANSSSVSRATFYHLAEGSELFPLTWLRALPAPAGRAPLMSEEGLASYGLLPDPSASENPEGLPVGMTLGNSANNGVSGIKVVGFNCAACHVGELRAEGIAVRIDGAPNMFDIKGFNTAVADGFSSLKSPRVALAFFRNLYRPTAKQARGADDPGVSLIADLNPATVEVYRQLPELDVLKAAGLADQQLATDLENAVNREFAAADAMTLEQLKASQSGALPAPGPTGVAPGKLPGRRGAPPPTPRGTPRGGAPQRDPRLTLLPTQAQAIQRLPGNDPQSRAQFASAELNELLKNEQLQFDFIKAVPKGGSARESIFDLLGDFTQTLRWIAQRVKLLRTIRATQDMSENTLCGPGRVDAFVTARNMLFGAQNAIKTESPICYPHLWGFGQTKWLHWDGNTTSVLERNIGQALGLGAIASGPDWDSSVEVANIHTLEVYARAIPVPIWPFTAPIEGDRAAGEHLFNRHCKSCHAAGINAEGRSDEGVGTDPNRLKAFNTDLDSGKFPVVLAATLQKIKNRYFAKNQIPPPATRSQWDPQPSEWQSTTGYVKRSLEGIWASAPYLHNGSVPSLDELLKKPKDRVSKFMLGGREFDVDKVGYVGGTFEFDTGMEDHVCEQDNPGKAGNCNIGHAYPYADDDPKALTDMERKQLIAYLKTI